MSLIKIATWNVNSLRVRLSQLLEWLAIHKPDVIVLQEIKLEDKDFPLEALKAAGYHTVSSGQKTYNGTAILSRHPITAVEVSLPDFADPQRRLLAATIENIRVVNVYVPNGSSVGSDKYIYKLDWLARLKNYLAHQLQQHERLLVLGDFNIAPEDRDVYDPKAWEGQVLVSEPERQALRDIMSLGLQDAFRIFEEAGGHYSWWDYRAGAFRRNHGLRIDHILITSSLRAGCTACEIDKFTRASERPSDHAPIIACFDNGCI